jgi:hypothetical protein
MLTSPRYALESVALLALAWVTLRATGRTLRDLMPPSFRHGAITVEPPDLWRTLVEHGVATPEELGAMTPAERVTLYEMTTRRQPAPPREVVVCPACGAPLGRDGAPIGYLTKCGACGRAIAVRREEDGRVSVRLG